MIKGTSMTASIPSENATWNVPCSQANWIQIPGAFQAHRMASQNPHPHLHQQHQQRQIQWNEYGRCVRAAVNWVNRVSESWSMHSVGCSVGASPISGFTKAHSPLLPRKRVRTLAYRYRIKYRLHHKSSSSTSIDRPSSRGVVCIG
jgi:hypothetical protein